MKGLMITKSKDHDHFWVENCVLFETYQTIRGRRCRALAEVLYPDSEKLSDQDIEAINEMLESKG